MNGEKLTVKDNVVFFGCVKFPAEKNKRTWSTISDLIKDSAHSNIAGICGKEEEYIRGWKTQGCI